MEKIIPRCLRKEPERRFQHMDDVKVELEELKEESDSGKLEAAGAPRDAVRGKLWWAGVLVSWHVAVALWESLVWFWLGRLHPTQKEASP